MKQYQLKIAGLALACGSLLMLSGSGLAGSSQSGTITVNADVTADCTFTAPSGAITLNFDPLKAIGTSSNGEGSATLTVTCTDGTTGTMTVASTTSNTGATAGFFTAEDSNSDVLGYDIYSDSGYSTLWEGTHTQSTNADGTVKDLSLYAKVASGQSVSSLPVASYSDTLQVTVNF